MNFAFSILHSLSITVRMHQCIWEQLSLLTVSLFHKSLAITHRWHSICQCYARSHPLKSGCRCCTTPWAAIACSPCSKQTWSLITARWAHIYYDTPSAPQHLSYFVQVFLTVSPLAPFRGRIYVWWGVNFLTSQLACWGWVLFLLSFLSMRSLFNFVKPAKSCQNQELWEFSSTCEWSVFWSVSVGSARMPFSCAFLRRGSSTLISYLLLKKPSFTFSWKHQIHSFCTAAHQWTMSCL